MILVRLEIIDMYVKLKPCKEELYRFTNQYIPDTRVVKVTGIDEEVYYFKQTDLNKPHHGFIFGILKTDVYEVTKEGEPINVRKDKTM